MRWAFHKSDDEKPNDKAKAERDLRDILARPIRCALCDHVVTAEDHRIERHGAHEHRFVNPGGWVFDVVLFDVVPGSVVHGAPTFEATWFPGFAWSYAHCARCHEHLGWCYDGDGSFFVLIRDRIVRTH
jgi:hypothetical protein